MTPKGMALECAAILRDGGTHISLIKPGRSPKGFPRGELLSETHKGKLYSYDAVHVLAWLAANGLVEIVPDRIKEPTQ